MTVYVDALFTMRAKKGGAILVGKRYGHRWCHMVADTDDELFAMAEKLGLERRWVQESGTARVHFDLTPPKRAAAIAAGAVEIDMRQLVEIFRSKRGAA